MLHGLVEPAFGEPAAGGGGGEDDSVTSTTGSLSAAGDQVLVDEAVDRPVGERPAERPDPADLAIGCEQCSQCPAVFDVLRDQSEADTFGERQITGRPCCRPSCAYGDHLHHWARLLSSSPLELRI